MLSTIIYYIIVGVTFNFLWDFVVSKTRKEENRFTMLERIIVTIIWPITILFFIFILARNLFFGNDQE
jgi:hypothetical protein